MISNDQLNSLMLYALRYVLPRSTYAVSDVCEIVAAHKNVLTDNTKRVMLDDIERELVERTFDTRFSHKCDEESIMRLHKALLID